jgi:hypothetical protein
LIKNPVIIEGFDREAFDEGLIDLELGRRLDPSHEFDKVGLHIPKIYVL